MKRSVATTSEGLPTFSSLRAGLALAAGILALIAIPHFAQAQGLTGGARDGSREGYRAAGPVGGLVGGAIGAGVGGAVGGVKGLLGIPDQGWNPHQEMAPQPAAYRRHHGRRHYRHHRRYR